MDELPRRMERSDARGEDLADYVPCHHASHASPRPDDETRVPDGRSNGTHGDVHTETSEKLVGLRQGEPECKATGIKAVVSSFHYAWGEAGFIRGMLPLLQLNQKDGFDCPGC